MFIKQLVEENPRLIDFSKEHWEKGNIEPDSYVIDLDMLLANAEKIFEKAQSLGIKLYVMTKQFGRNPYIAKKLMEMGYEGCVTVDYREADILYEAGVKIGNIGHLVQIPNNNMEKYPKLNPQVVTVYSLEKIESIDRVSKKLGIKQKILLKIIDNDSRLYDMQESGFHIDNLEEIVDKIKTFENIEIEGVTSFPCILFENSIPHTTKNFETLKKSKNILEGLGIRVNQINSPSGTSIKSLDLLKSNGCTHGEPGHSLTGTVPDLSDTREEKLAMLYFSEVSHNFEGFAYCFGGGHYRRGNLSRALVFRDKQWIPVDVTTPQLDSIDYYIKINEELKVGEPVIMCFRTQVFVTRSKVVIVEGLKDNKGKIVGTWDSLGKKLGE